MCCAQVEALVREVFRRTGHLLPQSKVMEDTPVSGRTLTAVFAPGGSAVGGGADVAKALRLTTEALGVKWVDNASATTFTIIILTGALLASPALTKQVCLVFQRSGLPNARCIVDMLLYHVRRYQLC